MRQLILALATTMLLSLASWGQMTPSEQAHASAAEHRREAKKNKASHHSGRHHHRKHRRHTGA
ncbi:MAG: hypothetical protein ACRD20_18980 [Terriglobales bacterium]